MLNVAFIYPNRTPYLAYWLGILRSALKEVSSAESEINLVLLASSEESYGWDSPARLPVGGGREIVISNEWKSRNWFVSSLKLLRALAKMRPRIIFICGYEQPESLCALFYAKVFRVPIVLMIDSKFNDSERFRRNARIEFFKSLIVARYSGVLCPSAEHSEYLMFLGAKGEKVMYPGFDLIDADQCFQNAQDDAIDTYVDSFCGLEPGQSYLLFIGRLVDKKNIITVLEAYAMYRATHDGSKLSSPLQKLVICGSGNLKDDIDSYILEKGLISSVFIMPWLKYESIPRLMSRATCLILASVFDQWGNVVPEALAVGTPVLVSNKCGSHNLVQNGINGFTFNPHDSRHLAKLMGLVTLDRTLVERMRSNARSSLSKFTGDELRVTYKRMLTTVGYPSR